MVKNLWKKMSLGMLALAAVIAVSGCGDKAASPSPTPAATAPATQAPAKKTTYPLTVKDATGKDVTFEKAPERIVSVSPAETEALYAIGLGDKIVGVSDYDTYPAEAKSKPKMGSIMKPNVEAVIGAKADVVFTGISMKAATVEELRNVGVKMFKVEPKTLDDVMNNILLYGKITDKQEQAEKVVNKMKQDRQKVADAVKSVKPEAKKKVYLEFSPGWTVGGGEFLDELIQIAGAVNVASEAGVKGWSKVDEELIIKNNPNVILFAKGLIDDQTKKTLEAIISERKGWSQMDAVAKKQMFGVDNDLISRPGPRLTDALLEIAKAIYPDLVK
ncbi:ABC transporter substrate-binding protein [Paenibacillus radicibacter]|uniref:ABC transporter substrate-binding protein n=1 Tax=Paenibacillus radicibacter TaxID=2972488 RepID=UPI00215954AB|nr:ABC transporter substrate-binding protein [Paenibacillus radicibacter]